MNERCGLTLALAMVVALSASATAAEGGSPWVQDGSGEVAVLNDGELAAFSGRQAASSPVLSTQHVAASTSGNSVVGETVGSGDIEVTDSAFSGFNGIGNFVVNTGHNNILQGSLSVTVVILP